MTVDGGSHMLPAVSRLASVIREAPTEIAGAAILRCVLFLAITRVRASSAPTSETLQSMERAACETLSMLYPSVVRSPTDTTPVSSVRPAGESAATAGERATC